MFATSASLICVPSDPLIAKTRSITASLISSSCEENKQHPIPDVYVNFTINVKEDPEFFRLQNQGSVAIITSSSIGALSLGYLNNGIIVYYAGDYEYMAFDRTCPHDLPANIAVEIEDNFSASATCPQCSSVYVFPSMGTPSVGSQSNWPLKEYKTIFNPNTGSLNVSN